MLSIRQQAALIQSRVVSATELVSAHLRRIAAINPCVNAIVTLDPERALAEAAAADAAIARGDRTGPLHGLPAAIKDTHDAAGMRTTHGSPLRADNVPDEDELVVARMRAAGAIVLGKTNVPEFGMGGHTDNTLFGPTRNPYDPALSAGGSSGGAAAALATGMATVCEGSDLGGSLRNPASFCNVVGLRPSPGRVPDIPTAFGWQPLLVNGPMGRTVDDTALLLSVIAGPHPGSPLGLNQDPGMYTSIDPADLRGLRVGWAPDLGGMVNVDPEVRAVIDAQIGTLLDLGCVVEEASIDFDGADEAFRTLRAWTLAYLLDDAIRRHRDQLKPSLIWNVEEGRWLSGRDIAAAIETQTRLYHRAREFFERYDLLVAPAASTVPFPVELEYPPFIDDVPQTTYLDWIRVGYDITMTGCPALALPAGFTPSGLPVGLQLVGPHHGERGLLAVGKTFEQANPAGHRRADLPALARRGLSA
ncbi:amidase [Rugosimonospora acidiphila]|uniref:Amidase n=1 Tax=Rugosimonospora acidiphila TaxID=556531 RepID=A0ABP9SA98_9ACTN